MKKVFSYNLVSIDRLVSIDHLISNEYKIKTFSPHEEKKFLVIIKFQIII